MPERMAPGPVSGMRDNCEAVCIHTKKIFDSCRDKDCIEDLRFYPTACGQDVLNRAQTVKGGKAELLYTYINVESVVFNRGFYTIDMRFFYRVTLNAYCANPRPIEVEGLCVFDKRVILFGSEGSAKIFSSKVRIDGLDRQMLEQSNMPVAVVEAVIYGQRFKTQENPSIIVRERRPTIGPRSCILALNQPKNIGIPHTVKSLYRINLVFLLLSPKLATQKLFILFLVRACSLLFRVRQ